MNGCLNLKKCGQYVAVFFQLASTSSEDSSSCSGESGRLRAVGGSGGGRLRLGVRMGTRRHQLDYTSSSDQSCDTVIYVGSDGCPVSDHELTDFERPPPPATMSARGSDGRVPSEQEDAGANSSLARVRGKSAACRSGLPRAVGGRHSDGELVTGVRPMRRSFSTRPAWRAPPPPPPPPPTAAPTKNGEMWIDGPKSMMTRVEQWVDGPPEFRHSQHSNVGASSVSGDRLQTTDAAEIEEETELFGVAEASTASVCDNVDVVKRFDEVNQEREITQSPQSGFDDCNSTAIVSEPQFTVVEVHQSSATDSEVTEVSSTAKHHASADSCGADGHNTSKDCDDQPDVERRAASGRSKLDVDALLLANRESIYELQMDEELETGSRESLLQLVCGSDDDWSTCGTEPRRSKCRGDSDGTFDDLDTCMKELNNMAVVTPELRTADTEGIDAGDVQQTKDEEPAKNDVVSGEAEIQQQIWIRTDDVNESATKDLEIASSTATANPRTRSVDAAILTTHVTRRTALPVPVSSSPSRIRRKPPPIPVRTSSVPQPADRSTTTNTETASVPTKTSSSFVSQKSLPDSKNGSASSHGFCSGDCSAATEADVTTTSISAATTQPLNAVVPDAPAARHPSSVPSSTTKIRSKIALPCRCDKKTKPSQPELPASSQTPSQLTPVAPVPTQATASREVWALVSPYRCVTRPQTTRGGGSDHSSSVLSSERAASVSRLPMSTGAARRRAGSARGTRSEVETSSGYESMMRDSEEVTGTSSASECQSPLRLKANKIFRKRGVFFCLQLFFIMVFLAIRSK